MKTVKNDFFIAPSQQHVMLMRPKSRGFNRADKTRLVLASIHSYCSEIRKFVHTVGTHPLPAFSHVCVSKEVEVLV
jgi:hypothetical protein